MPNNARQQTGRQVCQWGMRLACARLQIRNIMVLILHELSANITRSTATVLEASQEVVLSFSGSPRTPTY